MKVGIIGAGAIARRGHLPIYKGIPEVQVVGIADNDVNLAQKVASEFGIPRYAASIEELLADDSIELIDVCTPTPAHLDIIRIASARGKHILVEKPLAGSLRDALEIKRILERCGNQLCVVQNYRYSPSLLSARNRIAGGYLGKIVTMHGLGLTRFPSSWTRNTWLYHYGGALYDFGPHLIDLLLWVKDFTPVKRVYASGGDLTQGNMSFINYAVVNIEFEDGSVATADISWVTCAVFRFMIDIYGTGGTILIDVRNDVMSEIHGFATPFDDLRFTGAKLAQLAKGVATGRFFQGANLYYRRLIPDFVNSISGNGTVPVSIDQALATNIVLEAAARSIQSGVPINVAEMLALENTKV